MISFLYPQVKKLGLKNSPKNGCLISLSQPTTKPHHIILSWNSVLVPYAIVKCKLPTYDENYMQNLPAACLDSLPHQGKMVRRGYFHQYIFIGTARVLSKSWNGRSPRHCFLQGKHYFWKTYSFWALFLFLRSRDKQSCWARFLKKWGKWVWGIF